MKLLCELNEDITFGSEIVEAKDGAKKNYFIEGVFMQGDIKNRNGRVYPAEVLSQEVDRYKKTYVEAKRAFGELGHPAGPTINLDRVSHMIVELNRNGSNFVGKAKIMDTPMGKVVKSLMDEGAKLGVSSRGMGSMKMNEQGIMEVQQDFMLATAGDIVADPSAPDAFVNGVMENAEWVYDPSSRSWSAIRQIDELGNRMKNMTSKQLTVENKFKLFETFLNSLNDK